jgi:hypothetical protein
MPQKIIQNILKEMKLFYQKTLKVKEGSKENNKVADINLTISVIVNMNGLNDLKGKDVGLDIKEDPTIV